MGDSSQDATTGMSAGGRAGVNLYKYLRFRKQPPLPEPRGYIPNNAVGDMVPGWVDSGSTHW